MELPSLLVKVRQSLEGLQQKVLSLVVPLIVETVSDESSDMQDDFFFRGRRRAHVVARRVKDFGITFPSFPDPLRGVSRDSGNCRIRIEDVAHRLSRSMWKHAHEDPASCRASQFARVAIVDEQIEVV